MTSLPQSCIIRQFLPQPVNVLFRIDIFSLTYFRVRVFFVYIDNVSVTDIRNSLLQNAYLKLEGSGKIKTKHSRHWMDSRLGQVKNIFGEQMGVNIAGIQICNHRGQEVC